MPLFDWFRRLRRARTPAAPQPPVSLAAAFGLPDTPAAPVAATPGAAPMPQPADLPTGPAPAAIDSEQEAADVDLLRSAFAAAEELAAPSGGLADEVEDVDPAELMSEAHRVLELARSL